MKQITFASAAWSVKGKTTRREQFLAEMNAVIPWARLSALIEPHYPKTGNGRQPMPLERMLRVYFMQQWFNLSDPQAEDALYDIEPMRRFAGVELAEDAVPDETTILRPSSTPRVRPRTKRRSATPRCTRPGRARTGISALEEHRLTEAIFAEVASTMVPDFSNRPRSSRSVLHEDPCREHQTRAGA